MIPDSDILTVIETLVFTYLFAYLYDAEPILYYPHVPRWDVGQSVISIDECILKKMNLRSDTKVSVRFFRVLEIIYGNIAHNCWVTKRYNTFCLSIIHDHNIDNSNCRDIFYQDVNLFKVPRIYDSKLIISKNLLIQSYPLEPSSSRWNYININKMVKCTKRKITHCKIPSFLIRTFSN